MDGVVRKLLDNLEKRGEEISIFYNFIHIISLKINKLSSQKK